MRWRLPFLFCALAVLSGCAGFPSTQSNVAARVDAYVAKEEYGRALDAIASIEKGHPEYSRLHHKRTQVEAKAKAYEQSVIRRGTDLMGRGQWAEARTAFEEALERLPRSEVLRDALQEFRRKQAQRVEELQVEQLVGRARWMERAIPVQDALVKTDPDNWVEKDRLERLRDEARDLAAELTRLGTAALERQNAALAARTLPIAARLSNDPTVAEAKERLSTAEAEQAQKQRKTQSRALDKLRQQESRNLLAEYRQAMKSGDLRRARPLMSRLADLDGENPEVIEEQERFNARLSALVRKHMDEGSSLYGRGLFEEAIAQWNKVLDIDPDNEQARTSVDRAARVVEKLRQLREKQVQPTAQ